MNTQNSSVGRFANRKLGTQGEECLLVLTDKALPMLVQLPDFTLPKFSNTLKICHPQS